MPLRWVRTRFLVVVGSKIQQPKSSSYFWSSILSFNPGSVLTRFQNKPPHAHTSYFGLALIIQLQCVKFSGKITTNLIINNNTILFHSNWNFSLYYFTIHLVRWKRVRMEWNLSSCMGVATWIYIYIYIIIYYILSNI